MAVDFASILQAGQNLVPDMRQQLMQDAQLRLTEDFRRQQMQASAMDTQLKQHAFSRQQAFEGELKAAVESGDPRKISALMIKYPEFAEKVKPGFAAYSGDRTQRDLTQMGSIYARAQGGDYEGAAKMLDARIAADKAAGLDTSEDERIAAGLRSGDPQQQKIAVGTIGITMAASNPEKFGDVYGKLFPNADQRSTFAKEYDDRVALFGKPAADQWAATQNITIGPPGGIVIDKRDYIPGGTAPPFVPPQQPGGGDPAVGGYVQPVKGGTFGQGIGASRDGGKRSHNGLDIQAPLGSPVSPIARGVVTQVSSDPKSGTFVRVRHADGTTSSYSHLGSVTVKEGDPIAPGQSLGTVGQTGNATGPVLHLVVRDPSGNLVDPSGIFGGGSAPAGPVRVNTPAEAQKLPKGTRYITPDGQEFIR